MLKSLVVKLKRESTIRNPIDPLCKDTVHCARMFLSNVRGVAFYAVPHAGSSNIPNYVNMLLRCNNGHYHGLIDNIRPCQRDMEQLSVDFDDIANANEISSYAFCEGRPTEQVVSMCWIKRIFFKQLPVILVDLSSAQRLARYNFYKVEDANHMEVCKPPSKEHPSYEKLLHLIKSCQEVSVNNPVSSMFH